MIARTFPRFLRMAFSDMKVQVHDGIASDVSGMQNISQMPFYLSFKQGVTLSLENKLEEANQHYQQALNLLDDRKEQLKDHYMHIYRKLVMNNFALGKAKEVEDGIYGLIKLKKTHRVQSLLLYDDYDSLFQLFLKHNPEKAIVLGRALLSERQSDNLPLKHRKQFLFNLANAYFLVGNYQDAKRRYSECLESQPATDLKIRTYNNLALACWWAKNPLIIAGRQFQPEPHRGSSVDSDFKQTRGLFLKSIEAAENLEILINEEAKYVLKQALAEYQLNLSAKFSSADSILPMYNLTQFYIHNQPAEKVKILYWMRVLLQLSNTHASPFSDQIYTTLCLLSNEVQELQKVMPGIIKKHEGKIDEVYFSKIGSFLQRIAGKTEEAEKLIKKSATLEQKWKAEDPYAFKRKFLNVFSFKI